MKKLPKIECCPFCLSLSVKLHRNFDYVECGGCGARGHFFDGHPYDAITTWNKVSILSQKEEKKYQLKYTNMTKEQMKKLRRMKISEASGGGD